MGYREAIESAEKYISDHLTDKLDPADIAARSGYSYFHFCHVFRSMNGVGAGEYIRCSRLELSAARLLKGARVCGREGFRAVCLNDSSPIVTCLANDFAYEDVYSIQLRTYAEPGDLLIVFSGSGNSPNIVKGLQTAREMGLTTVGFGGRDGGKMKEY